MMVSKVPRLASKEEGVQGCQVLAQFLAGGIGLLADQLLEPLEILRPQRGRAPSSMGFGFEGAGLR